MGGPYERISASAEALGLSLPECEMAALAERLDLGEREVGAVGEVLSYLAERKWQNKVDMYLKMSRLPLKAPKTFANFDFGRLRGNDRAAIEQLPAMANLYARRNLAFIGPEGVGKTHLAQAYARECCERGMQSYYIKARELRDKLVNAVKTGKEGNVINTLSRTNCLVIDEIGRCVFDKECTDLLFHVVDLRCEREDPNAMILTSNYGADKWGEFFTGSSTLLCTLDRVFDNATVFLVKGPSFRGGGLETYALETAPVAVKAKPGTLQASK
jgi:DNA replication protein DnaC